MFGILGLSVFGIWMAATGMLVERKVPVGGNTHTGAVDLIFMLIFMLFSF